LEIEWVDVDFRGESVLRSFLYGRDAWQDEKLARQIDKNPIYARLDTIGTAITMG